MTTPRRVTGEGGWWGAVSHRRAATAGATLAGLLMAGCAPQTPTPTATPSSDVTATAAPTVSGTPSPSASREEFVVPEPSEDAIAWYRIDAASGSGMGSSDGSVQGVTYNVQAACNGGGGRTLDYTLFVDEVEVNSGSSSCDNPIVNHGFEAKGGEKVRIFVEPGDASDGFLALVEVVPAPS